MAVPAFVRPQTIVPTRRCSPRARRPRGMLASHAVQKPNATRPGPSYNPHSLGLRRHAVQVNEVYPHGAATGHVSHSRPCGSNLIRSADTKYDTELDPDPVTLPSLPRNARATRSEGRTTTKSDDERKDDDETPNWRSARPAPVDRERRRVSANVSRSRTNDVSRTTTIRSDSAADRSARSAHGRMPVGFCGTRCPTGS